MIGTEQWRAVVGTFVVKQPVLCEPVVWVKVGEVKALCCHRQVVCLFVVAAALMLCGDVELNPGPTQGTQQILAELKEQRRVSDEHFKVIRDAVSNIQEEMKEIKEKLEIQGLDIEALNSKVETVEEKMGRMEEKVERMEDEVEKMEQYSRRENVIMYGLEEDEEESGEMCRRKIVTCFNENTKKNWDSRDFVRVHRLGAKRTGNTAPRPVIARLFRHDDKFVLLEARDRFKAQGLGVANDLTPKQRGELRRLREDGKRGYFKGGQLHVIDPDIAAGSTSNRSEKQQRQKRTERGGRRGAYPRQAAERDS